MTTPLQDAQALADAMNAAEASDPKTSAEHTELLAKLHARMAALGVKYQGALGFDYSELSLGGSK